MSNDNIFTPLPIPTTAEVIGELRDVTVQYISVNDPTESAVRRHRVNQGEAVGLMATTAATIISAAAQAHHSSILETTPYPIHLPLPTAEFAPPLEETQAFQPPVVKKKRGRPPTTKPTNKSPLKLVGSKLSKKQLIIAQGSPKRKSALSRLTSPQENAVASHSNSSSSRRRLTAANIPSTSKVPPKTKIIPAIAKGRIP